MSDIADSTIAFSAYGMLCGAPDGLGRTGIHQALDLAGFECGRLQLNRALDEMLRRGWISEGDELVALTDAGRWVPCARKRVNHTPVKDWQKLLGWDGWCLRGPLGETIGLTDRLQAIGETA